MRHLPGTCQAFVYLRTNDDLCCGNASTEHTYRPLLFAQFIETSNSLAPELETKRTKRSKLILFFSSHLYVPASLFIAPCDHLRKTRQFASFRRSHRDFNYRLPIASTRTFVIHIARSSRFIILIRRLDLSFGFAVSIHRPNSSARFIVPIRPNSSTRFVVRIRRFDSSSEFFLSIYRLDSSSRLITSTSSGQFPRSFEPLSCLSVSWNRVKHEQAA